MMRFSTIAYAGVFSLVAFAAMAAEKSPVPSAVNPNVVVGQPPVLKVSDCATGFNKSNASGSPQSPSYSWKCTTPVIECPAAPSGMTGGLLGPTATPSGKGEVFSYACSYLVPPK